MLIYPGKPTFYLLVNLLNFITSPLQPCSKTPGPPENKSSKMKSRPLLTLVSLLFAAAASLPGQVSFEAVPDAEQVVLNGYFDVKFVLTDAEGSNFQPPAFDDFTVMSGPSRSLRTSIVNGKVSKELSYFYTLKPKRVGRLTIGSARITVNGRIYRTDPLTIEAVKGKAGDGAGAQFYVKAEPSVTEAYIGQQILLDYTLYTTVNIDNYNAVQESGYPGFYAENIRRFDSRIQRKVIDGVQMATKVLKRVALFPQQAGALTIDPFVLQLGIVEDDDNNSGRRSLLFNRRVKRVPVETEPVTIRVRSLPAGAPPSFTGAVGVFTANARISRTTVTTDDALSLRLSVAGNGDIKRVQPPALIVTDTFEVYDPTVQEEVSYELNGELTGKKIIEYLLVPKAPGQYALNPEFTYFDTDSARFVTAALGPFSVNVRPGSRSRRPGEGATPSADTTAQRDIAYLKGDLELNKGREPFFGSPLFWSLIALPLLALLGAVVIRRRRRQLSQLDPAAMRRKRARREAERRLKTADSLRREGQSRAFYDEISKAMLGYVSDKLDLPGSELSKDNVRSRLETMQVDSTDIEHFLEIMHNCEIALFAGKDNAEAMNETYEKTARLLTTIEARSKD